jgi:hypothetical protein
VARNGIQVRHHACWRFGEELGQHRIRGARLSGEFTLCDVFTVVEPDAKDVLRGRRIGARSRTVARGRLRAELSDARVLSQAGSPSGAAAIRLTISPQLGRPASSDT